MNPIPSGARYALIAATAILPLRLLASPTAPAQAPSPELAKAIVAGAPPSKPLGVADAKAKVKDAEKVVVTGKAKDFVAGKAVFTIVDAALRDCKQTGDKCPTPWDYCCEPRELLSKNMATVYVIGDAPSKKQQPLAGTAQGVNGLDHLMPITAEGTARRDKNGNLWVLASKVYLAPAAK